MSKKNHFVHLIVKLSLFAVILWAMDFLVGNTLRYYYFRQESGLQYRTTYSMEKTKADLLIFGSSRANHHYYPKIFQEGLDMTCYNTGRDGSYILYNYAVLKSVLKRYTPRVIILDFNTGEFQKGREDYDRLSSLLPYYQSHSEIRPIVNLRGRFEKYKLMSRIYPFNSSILTIAIGNSKMNKERASDDSGFVPLTNELASSAIDTARKKVYELDTVKVGIYKRFVRDCLAAGTKLYIIRSPEFVVEDYPDTSVSIAKEIAGEANVPFLDYMNDRTFSDSRLFSDIDHLNENGAIKFSEMLVKRMETFQTHQPVNSFVPPPNGR